MASPKKPDSAQDAGGPPQSGGGQTWLGAQQPELSDRDFHTISQLVYERFGINLGEQKRAMVAGRLQKVLRRRGMTGYQQYLDYVARDESGHALDELINRISTNHTYFFREAKHFEYLAQTGLPRVLRNKPRGERDLRVWCAGCSSGEEAYSPDDDHAGVFQVRLRQMGRRALGHGYQAPRPCKRPAMASTGMNR